MPTSSLSRTSAALVCALVLVSSKLPAQVTFTFNTTANATGSGYTLGNGYSFTFVTGSSFANNSSSAFETYQNYWKEDFSTDLQLITSVSGSGLSGSYTRPSGGNADPNSYIETQKDYVVAGSGIDGVWVGAKADLTNIGLTLTSGGTSVTGVSVRMDKAGTSFNYVAGYTDPTTFFSSKTGSYTPVSSGSVNQLTVTLASGGPLVFTISSYTISAAVPEPGTTAALGGLAALGGAALLRRRRRR